MKPEQLSRKTIFESPWFNLHLDAVKFPSGFIIEKFIVLDFPRPSVGMIVENEAGEVIFVRISRYATGLTEWEIPAGGVEAGETAVEAAEREVLEETGYTSSEHHVVYSYYPSNGVSNQLFHVVHCRAGEHVQAFDENEVNETRWFSRAEIRQMIQEQTITDGLALTALLLWLKS